MRFSNPADILSGTPFTKMNHYVERSSNTCFNGNESWFGTSVCSTDLNEFQDLGRKGSRQLPLGKSTMSWKGKGSSPKSHFSEGKLQVFGRITQPKIYRLFIIDPLPQMKALYLGYRGRAPFPRFGRDLPPLRVTFWSLTNRAAPSRPKAAACWLVVGNMAGSKRFETKGWSGSGKFPPFFWGGDVMGGWTSLKIPDVCMLFFVGVESLWTSKKTWFFYVYTKMFFVNAIQIGSHVFLSCKTNDSVLIH